MKFAVHKPSFLFHYFHLDLRLVVYSAHAHPIRAVKLLIIIYLLSILMCATKQKKATTSTTKSIFY